MDHTGAATVRKQIVVDAPIERAFTVFTGRFGDFKPPEHNMLGAAIAETVRPGARGAQTARSGRLSMSWSSRLATPGLG